VDRGQSDAPNNPILYGFTADATVKTSSFARLPRKFLFFGDSFTFGAGTMVGRDPIGRDWPYNCTNVPDYYPSASNYWSWGGVFCRDMNAECHYIGRGGRGLVINSDGTEYPRTLPHLVDRSLATVIAADWDHKRFIPEAIFLTIGQNDYRTVKCVGCADCDACMM
jgi:hypothetical protein